MAVAPDLVDAIAASVADLYREAETAATRAVARALRQGLDNPAAERRAGTLRNLRRSAQAIVAALEADTGPTVRDALAQAYRHGWRSALVDLPRRFFPNSRIAEAASEALRERSGAGFIEALATALHRDLGRVTDNILRNVVDVFRDVQAAAAARILTGTQTRREASQAAWQAWVDRGVTGFTDRAGRRWRLSSYAEMAARTNAQRAATQGQVDRLDSLGVELVYVSDTVQECVKCRPWEGKILRTTPGPLNVEVEHATRDIMVTVEAAGTLPEARAAGLFHPQCRHSISAYLPGVTRIPPGRPDPEGDKARQRQRALERRIRAAKEREVGALDEQAAKAARARVRAAQAALRQHLAEHPDLKRLRYREQIGAGNIPPAGHRDDPATLQGPPTEPTLDGGPAPAPPQRTRRRAPEAPPADDTQQPGPGQGRLDRPDPRDMSDADLEAALIAEMGKADFDEARINELSAEVDRREAEQRAAEERRARNREQARARREKREAEQAQRIADLIDEGWPEEEAIEAVLGTSVEAQRRAAAIEALRGQGYQGRGFEDLARQAYKDFVYQQYIAAEREIGTGIASEAMVLNDIDPLDLFTGPESRARKWATDELKAWWDRNGRPTFADFKAALLGRRGDRSGRDFLA